MDLFQIIALLFVVTAAFSYINDRFLRLPASIGLMLMALVMSAAVAGMGRLGPGVVAAEVLAFLDSVDFSRFLLHVVAALFAIPIILFARVISVGLPETILRLPQKPDRHTARVVTIITRAGLRGGISVAMVLSLDDGPTRDTLLTMTYAIVVFTMFVQGLTLSRVAAWLKFAPNNAEKQHGPNSNDQPPAGR
jgi:NhaP-type Na+/H+ or K+/H+ antiporter